MSEETKAALASVQGIRQQMAAVLAQLVGNKDRALTAAMLHAQQRMDEATMLLTLTAGGVHQLHPNVQALHQATQVADRAARVLLDGDVDFSNLSQEQIEAITNQLTLAESAYSQFRLLSTLALLHLSNAITLHERAPSAAEPQEGAPA